MAKEKVKNFIFIDGKYVLQEDIPKKKMEEISNQIMITFAGALGYKKCK